MKGKYISPVYHILLRQIHTQVVTRNKLNFESDIMGINSLNTSILLNISSVFEGYLNDILRCEINQLDQNIAYNNSKNVVYASLKGDVGKRIKSKLFKELYDSNWSKKQEIYELIYGENLRQTLGKSLYKAFEKFITIRNLISHGQTISMTISSPDGKISNIKYQNYEGKYKSVFQYYKNKLVLSEPTDPSFDIMQIISTNIINNIVIDISQIITKIGLLISPFAKKSVHDLVVRSLDRITIQMK